MNEVTAESAENGSVNDLTEAVIGAAIDEHRALGQGLLEPTHEMCLCHELTLEEFRLSDKSRHDAQLLTYLKLGDWNTSSDDQLRRAALKTRNSAACLHLQEHISF